MSDNLFKIEPLHPQILKAYRGRIQGDFDAGVDLEFDSLRSAAAWAETCSIAEQVALENHTVCHSPEWPLCWRLRNRPQSLAW